MIVRRKTTGLRAAWLFALICLCFGLNGCFADDEAMILPTDAAPLIIASSKGDVALSIEIADDSSEQQRGLMHRGRLADGSGMLFVLKETREAQFWMRNTPSPLDLVFVKDDGTIVTIKRGEPLSDAIISSDADVRFVLEIAAGEAQRLGLAPGDKLRHPVVSAIADKKPDGIQ